MPRQAAPRSQRRPAGKPDQLHFWPEDQRGRRLSWSVSRDRRRLDCLQKYYLYHYGARGGARAEPDSRTREIYVLKQLRNRHMWVGEVVHELIERYLRGLRDGREIPVDTLVNRGIRRMRADFRQSREGLYRSQPDQACGFVEHEYDEPLPRSEWKEQRDRMERCVRSFFELPLLRQLRDTPAEQWLSLESLSSFPLAGATVLVKPDLAWQDDADRVVIADWKTGVHREEEERKQLAVYALFAHRCWGPIPDPVVGHAVHLMDGSVSTVELGPDEVRWAEALVRESLDAMRQLARSAEKVHVDPAEFPLTDDLSRCQRCGFRRICGRGGESADV